MNQQDKYGRAPLHVAAAVDYVEMVEFLVTKGADVNIRTTGEEQTPIHFAAKNDACKSLKALVAYGVDVSCRDYQERTPLQVAHCFCFRFTLYSDLPVSNPLEYDGSLFLISCHPKFDFCNIQLPDTEFYLSRTRKERLQFHSTTTPRLYVLKSV
jgi:ankyrin repeat protein